MNMSDSTVMRRLSLFSAQSQDPSDSVVTAYADLFLDTFVKRDLVAFFLAHSDAERTLPELELELKTNRFVLLGQLRALRQAGLMDFHDPTPHTRVWHLASTRWADWIVRTVKRYWARHPEKRNIIVHHTTPKSN